MEYIAHIEEERKQRLIDHLDGTAKLAGKFAESFGKYEWGYCIGMLYDLAWQRFVVKIFKMYVKNNLFASGVRPFLRNWRGFYVFAITVRHVG